jgi:hypothetical protein
MKTARTYCFLLSACSALLAMPAWADDIPSASGECATGILETTPSTGYTLMESGAVVRHEATGLEWRRCPEGMTWSGSSCGGSATTMTWQEALQHADGVSGWRLPNKKELRSIVEQCRVGPAINQQAFPNTPSSDFWSASPYAGASDRAWGVNFDTGNGYGSYKSYNYRVRLVRGGQ